MKKSYILYIILVFCIMRTKAQDILTKKDGTEIKAIIKKVNNNSIEYVLYQDPNGILFTIDKVLLKKVKFSFGSNLDVKNPKNDKNYYLEDKRSLIMFNFLAFSGNTFAIAYEKNIKLGQSIMGEVKIYGLGVIANNFEERRNGFGFDFHYRLKTKSFQNNNQYRPNHILDGAYVSPVVGFSFGNFYNNREFGGEKIRHALFHFGLQYGKQWIIQRVFSIDTSIGLHYYIGGKTGKQNDETLYLGNMIGGGNGLISFNIRIGFLTGKTYNKK